MTTENSFNCILCNNKQFQTKEDLQNHFRIHADPNFSSKKNKLISQESPEDVDNSSFITCDVCPKVFPDPAAVLSHKRKIHPETYEKIFCSWCGKFFAMKLLFDRHLLEHDTDEKPEQTFNCDLCSIDFYNIPAMTYHNKFYHQQKNELAGIGYSKKRRRINETLVKILFCPHCGEESINKVNLHKHINDNHEEKVSVDSILRCPLCEAVFYSLDAYEMHLTFHSSSDVYISKKKSFWSKLSEYSLETLPPKIERIDNEDDLNLENNEILQGLCIPMEEDQFNKPILKNVTKKHKKHKKSKKSAITLDEFLNMNTDVFGEGLDFQGIEEVPTQVVAKQLKKKKPNVTTLLNIQKLKDLGINVKKKPSMNKPNAIKKIQVSNTLGRIKNMTDSDSKLQNNSPTACNFMLTKLLNQSKDLKIIKKSGEITTLKEVTEYDNNKDNSDEKSDPDMKVSVAPTHLSPNKNDTVIKKETIDETECVDSVAIVKSKDSQSENNDQVCKQEVFNDYENDDMNYDIDDATDFIKEEMDIEEETFNIPAAPSVIKKERDDDDDANESNEENQLEQNYNVKTNISLNSNITIKPSKNSPSTCSMTNTNNESDNKNKIANVIVTDVKIEPINYINDEDRSDLESLVTPSPQEVNQTELQNVDTKTKLLLNSEITFKSNNTNTVMNKVTSNLQDCNNSTVKQNNLEPKNEIPMHKLRNHLLSNSQITIKSPKSKELIKLSDVNEINKSEAESCEETVGYEDKCDNFVDASTSGTSKLKLLKESKDNPNGKNQNTDEIPTLAMNPKNMLLLNSQITVKSSNSNTKHGDGQELESSFDENYSDIDADSDSSTCKLHLSKKPTIKETVIDKNKNKNHIETSSMSPKNKLLLNSQITLKSTHNKPMDGKEKFFLYNESDKDSDSDTSQEHFLKNYQESALEKNKHINQIETSMSPKNKLLLNSQITLKSTNNESINEKQKDFDNESDKDGDSDSDSSQIHSLKKYQESAFEKNKHINQIKTATLSPKAKLLHNCNITVKSSPNSTLKKSSESGGEIVKAQKNQSSDSDSDDFDTIRNLNMIPNKNKIMFKPSNSLKNPIKNEELYSDDDEFNNDVYKKQNIQQQSGYTMNKIKQLKEETCFNNTNKILNNTQLTIKQFHSKSTANKVMSSNNSQQKITTTSSVKKNESLSFSNQTNLTDNSHRSVQSNTVQKIVKINESSRNTLNNTLKNFTGIKIKQHKQSTSSDDEVEYVGGLSDEELSSSLKPHKTIAQNPNKVNALSNVKNKLGVGVTVKNLNLKNLEDEDNLETESDDEIKEPVQIGRIVNKKDSIVNKLKTNNLGLSIKPLKQNINDNISDIDQTEASTSTRDGSRAPKISLEKNTNSNKHLMIKPYKPIENCNRDIKIQSLGQIKNANQNLIDNGGEVVKEETTSTSNEGETITQAVTVKQFKTETVIEEITTTVTKTIRTVSQAVNEEHSTTSTQKSLNTISQPSPIFAARPVKITNQAQRFVAPTNVSRIRQVTPRAPRAPRPMQNVMPVRCSTQPRPVVFRPPSPRGPRPVKIANSPNCMIRPSLSPQCTYKTVKIAPSVKTTSVQKPVQRVSPAADKTVHQVSTAQSFKASQMKTKNVSGTNTTKVVQRSMVASSQMKSEFSSSGTSQSNKVSMSSVNAKTVQKFESNVSKSNSSSLIEKLQQQGLLIKKPRLEVDFSDHSDDEETIDYDND